MEHFHPGLKSIKLRLLKVKCYKNLVNIIILTLYMWSSIVQDNLWSDKKSSQCLLLVARVHPPRLSNAQ